MLPLINNKINSLKSLKKYFFLNNWRAISRVKKAKKVLNCTIKRGEIINIFAKRPAELIKGTANKILINPLK